MVDINSLVLPGSDIEVVDALFINERGEVAGTGMLPNGDQHAVLLIPICDKDIAAANTLSVSESTSTAVHPVVKNLENSVSGGRSRMLHIFQQTQRLP